MKTEYRNAAAAKQKLQRAWAAEPESDTDGPDYTLTPTDEHEQCTRCGAAGHTMTDCTPTQARELAGYVAHDAEVADALRSLSDQVEALTADRDVLSAVVASYERVGIVAHDGMNAKVGWTKPVRHNTMLFAVKDPK